VVGVDPVEPVNGSHDAAERAVESGALTRRAMSWPASSDVDGLDSAGVDPEALEVARLEAEIAAAKARAATARMTAANRAAEIRTALRDDLAASQQQLADMERENEATVERIRREADDEAAQLLTDAEERSAAIRGRVEGERDADE
jgi:hypothetical protein